MPCGTGEVRDYEFKVDLLSGSAETRRDGANSLHIHVQYIGHVYMEFWPLPSLSYVSDEKWIVRKHDSWVPVVRDFENIKGKWDK